MRLSPLYLSKVLIQQTRQLVNQRFSHHSLKTRLTLAVLVVFVASLWATLLYVSQTLGGDLREVLEAQQFSTATLLAKQIDGELKGRLGALELEASGAAAALLAGPAAIQTLVEQRPALAALFNGGLTVVDAQGTTVADYPTSTGRRGVNYMDRPHIARALKEGKASITSAVIDKRLNKPVIPMAAPIRDGQGRVIGALAGTINLGLPNFLDQVTAAGYAQTGFYLLINPQLRQIVAATDKRRILEMLPARGVNPAVDRLVDGFEGTTVMTHQLGVEVLSSTKRIPANDWYLVVALPTQEAFAPLRDMQQRLLLLGLLLTVAGAGLVRWIVKQQLAPMAAAAHALATMTCDHLKLQPLPVARPDEVGQLVAGFNEVLHRVNESNAMYRAVLDAAPAPMALSDAGQNVIHLNPAFVATYGYRLSDIPTLADWLPLAYPDPAYRQWVEDTWRARAIQSQLTGMPFEPVELSIRCLNGEVRTALASASPVIDTAHNVHLVVLEDMTERKKNEAALRTSKDLLDFSQSVSQTGGWELTVATGHLYWTAETYRIHETTPAEFKPTVDAGVSYFLPESRRTITAALQAAMEHGQGYDLELETYTTKGRLISVRTTCSVTMDNGKPVKLTGIFQDISERKAAYQLLRDGEGRLAGVIDSAMDAIISVDPAQHIVLFNAAAEKMFGASATEMMGQSLDRLIPLALRARHQGHINNYVGTGASTRTVGDHMSLMSLMALRANGEEFPIEATISRVQVAGQLLLTAIVRDVTDSNRARLALESANRELARSNAELAQFAFVASHDLQEPLRSISSCVQLLQMRYQGQIDARADEFIAHAVGGSQRMQALIDDLLAYARTSAAPQVMRIIDLNAALQVARVNLSEAIAEGQALISHDELPQLTASPIQMARLFQNLLGNALKFRGGKAATVHVGARRDGAEWIISVADQGIGIAPEHFERIFGLFKRLHGRNDYPGTGIGLTICQKIVERHGGRIWVESVAGHGTTFFFTLPA